MPLTLQSLRNTAATAIAEWEGSDPTGVLEELTRDGDAQCTFMDAWCSLRIESTQADTGIAIDSFFFATVLLYGLETQSSKVLEVVNERNKVITVGHLVYADSNIYYYYRLFAEGVEHEQLNHVLSAFLQTAESAAFYIQKELGVGEEVALLNQADTQSTHKVEIDSTGLSGDYYIGDPSFLFQSDDQWNEFISAVDTEQTLVTYNGIQLALFNTHVDGAYLVYERIDGEYKQLDAIPIETAIIVIAPFELATADRNGLGENGMILPSNGHIICGYDLDDKCISSIRIGSLYIPVDPDLQDELIDRDEKRAGEAEQSNRETEMAKALEKRNKKKRS